MPPIETIARPVRNRISIEVPKQYRAYSERVLSFADSGITVYTPTELLEKHVAT